MEALDENETIENIIFKYKNHPSIRSIKSTMNGQMFSMPPADEDGVYNILRNLNSKKASGSDKISPKLAKHAASILSRPLSNIINATIEKQTFPNGAKLTSVKPIYKCPKDGSRLEATNYRPVSVISIFSKVIKTL